MEDIGRCDITRANGLLHSWFRTVAADSFTALLDRLVATSRRDSDIVRSLNDPNASFQYLKWSNLIK